MRNGWIDVTPKKKCPICKHDSYCGIGVRGVLCMRMESPFRVPHKDGAVGWFHPFDKPDAPRKPLPPRTETNLPRPDFVSLLKTWSRETTPLHIQGIAASLGVAVWALGALGCCFSATHGAWAFPMSNERSEVIGIRLRFNTGEKRAVLGSQNGLFIPDMDVQKRVFVCEGPSDTAAALSLGLWAVGRPSCSACGPMLANFLSRNRVREAVIMADNDKPGIEGAERLTLPCISTILLTPAKDVREFTALGGTRAQLESSLRSVIWRQPA